MFDHYSVAIRKCSHVAVWMIIGSLALICAIGFITAVRGDDRPGDSATVTRMNPPSGYVGDGVTIVCSYVDLAKHVDFNGIEAAIAYQDSSSTANEIKILVTVPKKAKTGHVHVITGEHLSLDAGLFTVLSVAPVASDADSEEQGRSGSSSGGPWHGSPLPPSPSPPPRPAFDRDLDLPLEKPVYSPPGAAPTPPTPPTPPVPVDNPVPPPSIYGHDLKSENGTVIYVIDVSGSMGWDMGQYTTPDGKTASGCRMDRAKASLTSSVMSLPKNFKFNMISYDCSTDLWRSFMVLATNEAKTAAISWISQLRPLGATGTGPAVGSALNEFFENRLIVLLTDGAPNCGAGDESGGPSCIAAHRSMISGSNNRRVEIDVFGIGATGDFKQFCQDIASDNGGAYTDVR